MKTDLGFDDIRVRQAISPRIDREVLAEAIYFGHAVPTYGPIASNWKWYEPGVEQFNQYRPGEGEGAARRGRIHGGLGRHRREGNGTSSRSSTSTGARRPTAPSINEADHRDARGRSASRCRSTTLDTAELFRGASPTSTTRRRLSATSGSGRRRWTCLIIFTPIPSDEYNGALPELKAAFDAWQTAATDEELEAAGEAGQLIWAEKLPKISRS